MAYIYTHTHTHLLSLTHTHTQATIKKNNKKTQSPIKACRHTHTQHTSPQRCDRIQTPIYFMPLLKHAATPSLVLYASHIHRPILDKPINANPRRSSQSSATSSYDPPVKTQALPKKAKDTVWGVVVVGGLKHLHIVELCCSVWSQPLHDSHSAYHPSTLPALSLFQTPPSLCADLCCIAMRHTLYTYSYMGYYIYAI